MGLNQLSYKGQVNLLAPLPQPVNGTAKSTSPRFLWLTSCPSPAPALPVMSWQVFPLRVALLSTLPVWHNAHMHASVNACTSISAPGSHITQHACGECSSSCLYWWPLPRGNGFLLTFCCTSKRQGRNRTLVDGTWIQFQSLEFCYFRQHCFLFFLRYKYVLLLPPCVCAFNYS